MALMLCELLNNADCYFCYVIKMLIMSSSECINKNATALSRCAKARLLPTINLSPATSFYFIFIFIIIIILKKLEEERGGEGGRGGGGERGRGE